MDGDGVVQKGNRAREWGGITGDERYSMHAAMPASRPVEAIYIGMSAFKGRPLR